MQLTVALETLIDALKSLPKSTIDNDTTLFKEMFEFDDVSMCNDAIESLSTIYSNAINSAISDYQDALMIAKQLPTIDVDITFDDTGSAQNANSLEILDYYAGECYKCYNKVSQSTSDEAFSEVVRLIDNADSTISNAYGECDLYIP